MKRYLVLFFLLIASIALCAYPEGAINNIDGSALGWDETNKVWRPVAVDANGKLKTTGSGGGGGGDTSAIEELLQIGEEPNQISVTELINGIGTDTSNIESDVSDIKSDVADIKTDVASLSSNLGNVIKESGGSGGNTDDVEALLQVGDPSSSTSVAELLNGIGTDTSALVTNVAGIKLETTTIKSDVYDIKTDVASLSSNIGNIIQQYGGGSGSGSTANVEALLQVGDSSSPTSVTELVNGIGTDTSSIAGDVSSIQLETSAIQTIVSSIDGNLEGLLQVGEPSSPVTVTELVNSIGTDTAGIKTDVTAIRNKLNKDDVETLYTSRKSITASTATSVGYLKVSPTASDHRTFIELRAVDPNAQFFIGFDSSVTDSTGRPVIGRILLNVGHTQNIYIYHTGETALAIQQTEGWN